jgi:6-phosphogluconate dehydrogenase
MESVIADLLEIDISIDASNSKYLDTRMARSEEQRKGIIYSSIDIKDYFEHWTITFS